MRLSPNSYNNDAGYRKGSLPAKSELDEQHHDYRPHRDSDLTAPVGVEGQAGYV
jgi:hypothetical protein